MVQLNVNWYFILESGNEVEAGVVGGVIPGTCDSSGGGCFCSTLWVLLTNARTSKYNIDYMYGISGLTGCYLASFMLKAHILK